MCFGHSRDIKRDWGVVQRGVVVSADWSQEIRDIGPEGFVKKPYNGVIFPVSALKNQVHCKEGQDAVFRLPWLRLGQEQDVGKW